MKLVLTTTITEKFSYYSLKGCKRRTAFIGVLRRSHRTKVPPRLRILNLPQEHPSFGRQDARRLRRRGGRGDPHQHPGRELRLQERIRQRQRQGRAAAPREQRPHHVARRPGQREAEGEAPHVLRVHRATPERQVFPEQRKRLGGDGEDGEGGR